MPIENQPVLQFLTDDENSRKLAIEYWAGSHDGERWKWDRPVREIASRHGVMKTNVAGTVRTIAIALDHRVTCRDCGAPKHLESRSDYSVHVRMGFICDQCRTSRSQAEFQRNKEAIAKAEDRKLSFIRRCLPTAAGFDYRRISYFDACILYGIMLASDDAAEMGEFGDVEAFNLCSGAGLVMNLIGGLFERRLLRFSPVTPLDSVKVAEDGASSYYPLKAVFKIERDAGGDSYPTLMNKLGDLIESRTQHPEFQEATSRLWWLLAFDDALHFLLREVANYRIAEYRRGPKTDQAVKHALLRFSIPQVRRQISYVVKNAAALSVSREFNARHALNTIPGSLISYADRALSENWTIYPVLKDWMNEEPVLITLLFNRVFGTGLPGFKTLTGGATDYDPSELDLTH